jgi:hypothetical protein
MTSQSHTVIIRPFSAKGRKVASNRLKELGWWIGLAAMALQIAFAPILSSRALAMELDPLAQVQICVTPPDGSQSPQMPADHAGHCTECCIIHCGIQGAPILPPIALEFPVPQAGPVSYRPLGDLPPLRGPPRSGFTARGPPILA